MTLLKTNPSTCSFALLRRFGLAGFTFFLLKGLLWLAVPMMAGFLIR